MNLSRTLTHTVQSFCIRKAARLVYTVMNCRVFCTVSFTHCWAVVVGLDSVQRVSHVTIMMLDLFLVEFHSRSFRHSMETQKGIFLAYTVSAKEAFVLAPI